MSLIIFNLIKKFFIFYYILLIALDIKSNPNSYNKIDEFFNGKHTSSNKFNKNKSGGDKNFKFKNNKFQKKPQGKRPGKIARMNHRNKKFSKKAKK